MLQFLLGSRELFPTCLLQFASSIKPDGCSKRSLSSIQFGIPKFFSNHGCSNMLPVCKCRTSPAHTIACAQQECRRKIEPSISFIKNWTQIAVPSIFLQLLAPRQCLLTLTMCLRVPRLMTTWCLGSSMSYCPSFWTNSTPSAITSMIHHLKHLFPTSPVCLFQLLPLLYTPVLCPYHQESTVCLSLFHLVGDCRCRTVSMTLYAVAFWFFSTATAQRAARS